MLPAAPPPTPNLPAFLQGPGEMKQLIAQFPWEHTALGPLEQWPATLKTTLALLLNSRFPMYLMWGPQYLQFYNDAYRPSLGLGGRHPGILGQPAEESWPEAWPMVGPMIDQVYREGLSTWNEDTLVPVLRNGQMEDVYWTFSYSPVYDELGAIVGVLSVCTENNQRVVHLRQQAANRQRMEQLLEQMPIGIAVLEGEDLVVKLSNTAIRDDIWKQPLEKVQNKRLLDFQPEIADQPFPKLLRQVLRTGETHEEKGIVANLVNEAGEPRQYYLDLTYQRFVNEKGEANSILATVLDRTETYLARKAEQETERNMRSLILSAPVAMAIVKGPEFRLEIGNPTMFALLGRSEAELLGKPVFSAMPEVEGQGFQQLLAQVMEQGSSYEARERPVPLLRKGVVEMVYVNFVFEPYREVNGEITGAIVVAIDVHAQVLARQQIEKVVAERTHELAEANQQLQRTNQELEQFAYIASHDLQEPLRKVHTFAEMLGTALKDAEPKAKFYLEKIMAASQRMTTLIRDVLNYSQLNGRERAIEPVDLGMVAQQVRSDLDLLLEQKEASLTVDKLPVVQAIHLQMHQLLYNLIGNSLKFTRPGVPAAIRVTARRATHEELAAQTGLVPGAAYWLLQVSDNGIGFSQEYAQQIFTIFKRLHGKEEFAGTGIGLALCKKIVTNHQGAIWAEGRLGEGADFFVLLPAG